MVKKLVLRKESYPNEKVPLWAITSQEVKRCVAEGNIPQIVLPKTFSDNKPVIAVILAQDAHPDRLEKDYTIFPDYVEAILQNGGFPIFIAYEGVYEQLVEAKPDGILLIGGNFRLVKGKRGGYETRPQTYITMIEYAKSNKIPLFAICGGEQMMAVYFGAKPQTRINDNIVEKYVNHMQKPYQTSHRVFLGKGTQIRRIINQPCIDVNSCHNTAVSIDNKKLSIFASGKSDDGIVEVVELKEPWNNDFVIGVQWHPERLAKVNDDVSQKLFNAFVNASMKMKFERMP